MTERRCPVLWPTVVRSSAGSPGASQPSLPDVTVNSVRWARFMAFSAKSLGIVRPLLGLNATPHEQTSTHPAQPAPMTTLTRISPDLPTEAPGSAAGLVDIP